MASDTFATPLGRDDSLFAGIGPTMPKIQSQWRPRDEPAPEAIPGVFARGDDAAEIPEPAPVVMDDATRARVRRCAAVAGYLAGKLGPEGLRDAIRASQFAYTDQGAGLGCYTPAEQRRERQAAAVKSRTTRNEAHAPRRPSPPSTRNAGLPAADGEYPRPLT